MSPFYNISFSAQGHPICIINQGTYYADLHVSFLDFIYKTTLIFLILSQFMHRLKEAILSL